MFCNCVCGGNFYYDKQTVSSYRAYYLDLLNCTKNKYYMEEECNTEMNKPEYNYKKHILLQKNSDPNSDG